MGDKMDYTIKNNYITVQSYFILRLFNGSDIVADTAMTERIIEIEKEVIRELGLTRQEIILNNNNEYKKKVKYMIKKDFDFTPEKAEEWLLNMQNEDGTTGPHWSLDETNAYRPAEVSEYCWECAMNMMYSDYYSVAIAYGVNSPEFYADLARAFLFDKDAKSPRDKMAAYYNCIVSAK